jgi:aminoglycoside phosphotransferase (APT) family kinase protein
MDLDAWSEYELLVACSSAPVIFTYYGTPIKRLTEHIAVKISSTDEREYRNQVVAHQNLQDAALRVPRPLRFFVHPLRYGRSLPRGYLFMEYIKGLTLEQLFARDPESKEMIMPQVRSALQCLKTVKSDVPGSLWGGSCVYGFPWADNEAHITSIEELQARINQRLEKRKKRPVLTLPPAPYILCHLDINLRNIIITDEGKDVVLLDWNSAAFYPESFELASLAWRCDEHLLTERTKEDIDNDHDLHCLGLVQSMSIRWHLCVHLSIFELLFDKMLTYTSFEPELANDGAHGSRAT